MKYEEIRKDLLKRTSDLINRTPSGLDRNLLTDIQLFLMITIKEKEIINVDSE